MSDRNRIPSGTMDLGCLDQPVDLYWDRWGIPHIFAKSVPDAYRALGFAVAHERLWQMELGRVIASGRASSLFGKRYLWSDATVRTFDVTAERVGIKDCEGDWVIDAYFEGVNRYVDTLDALPPEFESAGSEPSHFQRGDAAVRHRHLTWYQYHCWVDKIALARLTAAHGAEHWRGSVCGLSADDDALIDKMKDLYSALDPSVGRLVQPAVSGGSNNWVVGPGKSESGMPLIGSDPHLPLGIPTVFFNAHLEAPDFSLTGACFPDMGTFPIGHSRRHAWCITTGRFDNYDLFIEELDENDNDQYRTPDGFQQMDCSEVEIEVKDEAPFKLPIKQTCHGPTFEPIMEALGYWQPTTRKHAMALRWAVGQTATPASAFSRLPLAKNADEFAQFVYDGGVAPTVFNLLYGDTDGEIQRFAATHVPKREGVTSKLPLPGWEGGYEWPMATPDDLRLEHNPERGFVATANNDTLWGEGKFPLHNFPLPPTRCTRIFEVLKNSETFRVADSRKLQTEPFDINAAQTVPAMVQAAGEPQSEAQKTALGLLAQWDFRATPQSVAACVHYVLNALHWEEKFAAKALDADGLDGSLAKTARQSAILSHTLGREVLFSEGTPWAKHREALLGPTLRELLDRTVAFLTEQMGAPEDWAWGKIHTVRIAHGLAGLEPFGEHRVGPHPIGGSGHSVGVAPYVGRGPYNVHLAAVIRMQVDLAHPDESEWVISTGNSGRADSVHTTDMYPLWLAGDYVTLPRTREDVENESEAHWKLGQARPRHRSEERSDDPARG